jgi:serine/threonine-protein kinase
MGTVYLASHALLRRPTAIKLMRPRGRAEESLRRFEQEVQVTSQLTHPNTVAVYDYGRTPDGTFYYAMEYLEGVDLERLVRRFGPQPAERVVHILAQVCGALHEAHLRSLVHRDVKPANILVCDRGGVADHVKVLDFGLAKRLAKDDALTQEGALTGTPAYIAPEAFTSPDQVGPASDLYALGAVAYLLLTGQRPFEGATVVELCAHHLTSAPVPPSDRTDNPISPELERVVLRCLAKRPNERPASAQQLAAELAAVPEAGRWTPERASAWWGDPSTASALQTHTDMRARVATMNIDLAARIAP